MNQVQSDMISHKGDDPMAVNHRKTYQAESADIKHLISGQKQRNDHCLHSMIRFNRQLDVAVLKRAVRATFHTVPLLTCRFVETERIACWEEAEWTEEDIVTVVETEHHASAMQQAWVSPIDETKGPQLRLTVVRGSGGDTLVIVMNHMVCDGGGMRDYLFLLADAYSAIFETPPATDLRLPAAGSRSIHQVFDHLNEQQLSEIQHATLHRYRQTEKDRLPLKGDVACPYIHIHRIPSVRFTAVKQYAKRHGATINDALFAAYVCALSGVLETEQIVLDCPVNLRGLLPEGYVPGICNLTSNIVCAVPRTVGNTFDGALLAVKSVMDRQKGSLKPLNVYWELERLHRTLPLNEAKRAFPKVYNIPLNGMTNIGILHQDRLKFGPMEPIDACISGSIKYAPYFQIAVTTFNNQMTFSTNFYGTAADHQWIDRFVENVIDFLPG